jgi:hypothetical protein
LPRRRTRALVLGGIRQAQREIGLYLGTMSFINIALGGPGYAAFLKASECSAYTVELN